VGDAAKPALPPGRRQSYLPCTTWRSKDGEIAVRLLEDIGERAKEVTAAAERLAEWLGPSRFVPKFRTPLEHELMG
jgi:hypothetical protein